MNRVFRVSRGAGKSARRLRRACLECDVADAIDAGHFTAGQEPRTLIVDLTATSGVLARAYVERGEDNVHHIFLVRRD